MLLKVLFQRFFAFAISSAMYGLRGESIRVRRNVMY